MNRMTFLLLAACIVAVAASPRSFAQVLIAPPLQELPASQPAPPNTLTLRGASLPDPLLRHRFWPEPSKRIQENATALVSRAVILELQVPPETKKRFAEKFNAWHEMPIDQLPSDEVRELLGQFRTALRELERAENLMRTDYPLRLDQLSAPELVQTLLPEFQEMRTLARLLSLRAKLAIAEHRWDDMIRDCRVGFRLAEVAGHSTDFLIGRLVGFAISSTMMDVIETAIQQPECPSLYWALASLPADHLFETRDALEFESILVSRVFSGAEPLPHHPIGPVAARARFRTIAEEAKQMLLPSTPEGRRAGEAKLLAGAYIVMMTEPSRDLLAATPQWGDRAHELSAPEAVLRATLLKFARARDSWVAWSLLPPDLWGEYEPEWKEAFAVGADQSDMLVSIVDMLTPAVHAARNAGRRVEQLRNWLITIEAIRLHASQTGELPLSLDHLRPVPVWNDTMGGQPFGYQRSTPGQATLTRAPRHSDDPNTTFQINLKGMKQ